MDGRQSRLTQSLQFRLSLWLSLLIIAVAIAAGLFSWQSAFDEANDLQDDQLTQVVALINHYQWSPSLTNVAQNVTGADPESRLVIQRLTSTGYQADPHTPALHLPANLPNGMQTLSINHQSWRVYIGDLTHGGRVAVAQSTDLRDEIARNSALRTITPFALLIPILLLLAGSLVRYMLLPLKIQSSELNQRKDQDMRAVDATHLPSEVHPFIQAINRLLARVEQSMALERRFVADAAHELRSPITALLLQAERLEAAEMSPPARERLATLRTGLLRSRLLLEQLLTLARAQQTTDVPEHPVSVADVFRQVLEQLMPLAEAKQIDIGVEGAAEVMLVVPLLDLSTLIKNLVENAIRYTPDGGRVDLSVDHHDSHVTIRVKDSGPGIAPELHQRVFDPFYRILGNTEMGSGLGLSIVKAITDRLGASISLTEAHPLAPHPGLCVNVSFQTAYAYVSPPQ